MYDVGMKTDAKKTITISPIWTGTGRIKDANLAVLKGLAGTISKSRAGKWLQHIKRVRLEWNGNVHA